MELRWEAQSHSLGFEAPEKQQKTIWFRARWCVDSRILPSADSTYTSKISVQLWLKNLQNYIQNLKT